MHTHFFLESSRSRKHMVMYILDGKMKLTEIADGRFFLRGCCGCHGELTGFTLDATSTPLIAIHNTV
jgi:hypothetical protein